MTTASTQPNTQPSNWRHRAARGSRRKGNALRLISHGHRVPSEDVLYLATDDGHAGQRQLGITSLASRAVVAASGSCRTGNALRLISHGHHVPGEDVLCVAADHGHGGQSRPGIIALARRAVVAACGSCRRGNALRPVIHDHRVPGEGVLCLAADHGHAGQCQLGITSLASRAIVATCGGCRRGNVLRPVIHGYRVPSEDVLHLAADRGYAGQRRLGITSLVSRAVVAACGGCWRDNALRPVIHDHRVPGEGVLCLAADHGHAGQCQPGIIALARRAIMATRCFAAAIPPDRTSRTSTTPIRPTGFGFVAGVLLLAAAVRIGHRHMRTEPRNRPQQSSHLSPVPAELRHEAAGHEVPR